MYHIPSYVSASVSDVKYEFILWHYKLGVCLIIKSSGHCGLMQVRHSDQTHSSINTEQPGQSGSILSPFNLPLSHSFFPRYPSFSCTLFLFLNLLMCFSYPYFYLCIHSTSMCPHFSSDLLPLFPLLLLLSQCLAHSPHSPGGLFTL